MNVKQLVKQAETTLTHAAIKEIRYDNVTDWICEYDILKESVPKNKGKILLDSGATKIVFIPKKGNSVAKVPITSIIEDYDPSSDRDESDEKTMRDYCAEEVKFYSAAKEKGIEDCFAKTYFYKQSSSGMPIYIQDKLKGDLYLRYSSNKNTAKASNILDKTDGHEYLTTPLTALFVEDYGKKKTKKLLNFLVKHDINDVCDRNCGIAANGKIVIMDYAGYRER